MEINIYLSVTSQQEGYGSGASWAVGVIDSNTTVRKRLMGAGLNARETRKKPKLTRQHKQLRLEFAREHQDWTWVDWSVVISYDESRFTLFRNDGRTYVRRRVGEALLPECMAPTVKFGGGGVVVVWWCGGVGSLNSHGTWSTENSPW